MLVNKNCEFISVDASFCAVNPYMKCVKCLDYKLAKFKEDIKIFMPSSRMINKLCGGAVTLSVNTITRNGRYRVREMVSVCERNGFWCVHSWQDGGPYKNSSFYGQYVSKQQAARAAILMYEIVALDSNWNAIIKK